MPATSLEYASILGFMHNRKMERSIETPLGERPVLAIYQNRSYNPHKILLDCTGRFRGRSSFSTGFGGRLSQTTRSRDTLSKVLGMMEQRLTALTCGS